jgi:hypothetical protein
MTSYTPAARRFVITLSIALLAYFVAMLAARSQPASGVSGSRPVDRVYVPYEKLKEVFGREPQGVFLPYEEFQKLWKAAQGQPAGVEEMRLPYLISVARFSGKIEDKLATLDLELTVDILEEGWVVVPLGIRNVAVAESAFKTTPPGARPPLLNPQEGSYQLLASGKGRWVLSLKLVRQLTSRPGLNLLELDIPSAAISTLDLLIPEENLKVDLNPALASTTTQVDPPAGTEGTSGKWTKLQAFLGSARRVNLSWKPRSQAASDLAAVVISRQLQDVRISEALLSRSVQFDYEIRRRGIEKILIEIPTGDRVVAVEGDNIRTWDIKDEKLLTVELFSEVKDAYALKVRTERFLKDNQVELPLEPFRVRDVLRSEGLIAISHVPRRSVEVRDLNSEIVRVDVARLPDQVRQQSGVTAYQFASDQYAAKLEIGTVEPRIMANHHWTLAITKDALLLNGNLEYTIERAGVFALTLTLPEPWEVESFGPDELVDDHEIVGEGASRAVRVTLDREIAGAQRLQVKLRANRAAADAPVNVTLPAPDKQHLALYNGLLIVQLSESLRAEVGKLTQLQPIPLQRALAAPAESQSRNPATDTGEPLTPTMAFEFRALDRAAGEMAAAELRIALKPPQVSAVGYHLVNIQPGSVEYESILNYNVRYAPVDTFFLKMPAGLADRGVAITGPEITEKPRIEALPADQAETQDSTVPATVPPAGGVPASAAGSVAWAYYKIVLQSPRTGSYKLTVRWRQALPINREGENATVELPPVLAAGRISDQNGVIAITKSPVLAIAKTESTHLIPADPSSSSDVPHEPHRKQASLAFRYTTGAPFSLSLPVTMEKEAEVFTTIANAVVIEQVLGLDGAFDGRAVCLLSANRADRLPIKMPEGAKIYSFLVNGQEVPVEAPDARTRVVRLPSEVGEVSRILLEVTYGLDRASASSLPAPEFPAAVPVQRTVWRVHVPPRTVLLGHDSRFVLRNDLPSFGEVVRSFAEGHPTAVSNFNTQGELLSFERLGSSPTLALYIMRREMFSLLVWAVIIGAGVILLWCKIYVRVFTAFGFVAGGAVLALFVPNFVAACWSVASAPIAIVIILWLLQFLFFVLPSAVDSRAAKIAVENLRREEAEKKREVPGSPEPPKVPDASFASSAESPPPAPPPSGTPAKPESSSSLEKGKDQDKKA